MGWYSTGPRLREADLNITDLMTEYVDNPILVICEVQACLSGRPAPPLCCCAVFWTEQAAPAQPKTMGLPTTAYFAKEEIKEVGHARSAAPPAHHALCAVSWPELGSLAVTQGLLHCADKGRGAAAGRHAEEPEGVCQRAH